MALHCLPASAIRRPLYELIRPCLFALDAERAHDLALTAIQAAYACGVSRLIAGTPQPLPTKVFGIEFPNPVGLAAGLDKNGDYFEALAALGFGFVEIGTITPKPQPGNPKPRMFRLNPEQGIINRLGFNNKGLDYLINQVARSRFKGVLGINIGKNKSTPNEQAASDYLTCLARVYPYAGYITVNISSPNTQGLRDLQQEHALYQLVSRLREAQEKHAALQGLRKPVLLKIAPDLDANELDAIAHVALTCHIDGLICTNTTIDRDAIADSQHKDEPGGLSGRPLFAKATKVLHEMAQRLEAKIPLIGVGGILSGDDAAEKIQAGASLVQFYTGMIYRGPALIAESVAAIGQLKATGGTHAH